jgi:hypothetical protein
MKQNRLQALCILSASAVFSGNVAAYGLGDIGPAVLGFTMGTGFTLQRTIQDIHTWQSNTQLYGVPMSPTLFNPLLATEVSPGLTVKEALSNVGAPIDLTSLPTVDLITSLPAAILNLRIIDNVDGSLNTNTLKEKTQEISRFAWDTNKKIKELTDPVTGLSTKVTGIDNRLFNVANWAYDTNKLLLPKLATEVTSVKADVTGMVTDVTDVKNDVSGMVSDLGLVKAAVDTLSTVGTEFGEVVTVVGQVDDKVVSLGSSVASVGSDVATVIDDLGAIDTALDAGVFSINDQISVALGAIERVEKVVADPNLTTAFDILATDGASIVSNLEAVVEDAAKMQTLVNNVNNIMDQMPTGIDVEISDMLMAAQNLLEFSRARAADAESLAVTFVDQTRLITATYKLADALKGDVLDDIKFNVLLDLLNVMPYQLVNLTGYGLQLVGVNTLFIEKIEQATLDVVLLREVKTSNRLATGSAAFLPAGSAESCNFVESKRGDIKESSQRVSDLGKASTIIGKALIAIGNTAVKVPTEPVLGVHGYASFKIKNNMLKKFGSIFDGIGQVLSSMADSTDGKLNHCEVIHYQQAILETTCYLTRGRGPMCQRWVGSEEQSNMLN